MAASATEQGTAFATRERDTASTQSGQARHCCPQSLSKPPRWCHLRRLAGKASGSMPAGSNASRQRQSPPDSRAGRCQPVQIVILSVFPRRLNVIEISPNRLWYSIIEFEPGSVAIRKTNRTRVAWQESETCLTANVVASRRFMGKVMQDKLVTMRV